MLLNITCSIFCSSTFANLSQQPEIHLWWQTMTIMSNPIVFFLCHRLISWQVNPLSLFDLDIHEKVWPSCSRKEKYYSLFFFHKKSKHAMVPACQCPSFTLFISLMLRKKNNLSTFRTCNVTVGVFISFFFFLFLLETMKLQASSQHFTAQCVVLWYALMWKSTQTLFRGSDRAWEPIPAENQRLYFLHVRARNGLGRAPEGGSLSRSNGFSCSSRQ